MAGVQCTFERVEKKFVLTQQQAERFMQDLTAYMAVDAYGQHTIRNLYYDTDDYALVRKSIAKPTYKAKFRLRAYGTPAEDSLIFAELKKKYKGVVYKRRIAERPQAIQRFLAGETLLGENPQIQRELHRYFAEHTIRPKVFLAYERVALYGLEDSALRVTFDTHLRFRTEHLERFTDDAGTLICPDDPVILEVKLAQAAPLWLARLLSQHHLYMSSFSKYGTCYLNHLARRTPDVRPMAGKLPTENIHQNDNDNPESEGEIEHAS